MKKLKRMLALLLTAAVCLTMGGFTSARTGPAASGGVTVSALYTEAQTDPIGLDQVPPELSWTLRSDGMNQKQTAYRVLAASSAESLAKDTGDVWDSGRVESETPFGVSFGGTLASRQKVFWKVMIWDASGSPSAWSDTATFEMGLLEESDWEASWIGRGSDSNIITSGFAPVTARYVRMKVVRVGPNPLAEGWNRLQFMEWEIYSGGSKENLARGKKVTATDEVSTDGAWAARNLTNGAYTNGWHGYSTNPFSPDGRDIADRPVYVTMDLGERTTFDTFRLYGRTDAPSNQGDVCPNYPEIYDIEVSDDGRDWATHTTVTVTDPPRIVTALPLFAKDFTVDKSEVASARLYVSGLGLYEARLNGQNVADTLFDPGETDFDESVQYVTYDVTDKLLDGGNAVGIMLGNGVYNIGNTPGRYQKVGLDRAAEIKTIAQLEVTMKDGSVQRVVTDGSWDQTQGPVTFSSWHGGEDYDARAEIPGWDAAGTDRSAWGKAGEVNPPAGALRARNTTPIRVTGEVTPVSVKQLANGHYLVDMGVNFAGIYTLRLPGMRAADAGKTVKIWPSETLKADGTVDQTSTGAPIFDTYIIGGGGDESFHIRFCYHGFRYLEIENMPFALKPEHITGQIVRTDNERIGRLSTSSDLINGVERIVDRAIESNMYSTLTDCPAREKLGWLEVSQLMYESMAYSYDIRSWMTKTSRDMAEAQTEAGQVPGVAPEYVQFEDSLRSDPSWGGASILVPWYTYQVYGQNSLIQSMYPTMVKYMDYLEGRSSGNLIDIGLGDWGAYDTSTPRELVVSATYYNLADVMSQIAKMLGKRDDASRFSGMAKDIKAAFNAKYFDAATGKYGSGSQASYACALFAGLVPEEKVELAVDNLVKAVETRDWHLSTGEVGLRQMFAALGKYGRSDVVYKMAVNKTMPSYGYFIENNATSLPEFWDMSMSQNHCMMGHIKEWFYKHLAGMDKASPGFKEIVVKPYIPDDMDWVRAFTMTSYGELSSAWEKGDGGSLTMNVTIPVGTTADIYVPDMGIGDTRVRVNGQMVTGVLKDGYLLLKDCGSGDYVIERIDPASQTLFAAKQAADAALAAYTATNETDARSILAVVEGLLINPEIRTSWTTPFQKTDATVQAEGSITGEITLTLSGDSAVVPVHLRIEKLQKPFVKGDLNGDGSVNVLDVMACCKVLARKAAGQDPTDDEIARGDMNGDTKITVTDVMAICKILAEK